VNKKMIILTAAAGIIAFAATFGLSFMKSRKASLAEQAAFAEKQKQQAEAQKMSEQSEATPAMKKNLSFSLTEQQLESLIYDVSAKAREYNEKMKQLKVTEQRLSTAKQQLQKDIDALHELRTELASTAAALKQERDKLNKTRIEINQSEEQNYASIAATYDRMKAEGAAKIFVNMSQMNTSESKGLNDVVKILYYMNDRTKAKVLAELVGNEPKLAAVLSQELKKIKEVPQ
jgi:chromosome segregation ATPase